MVFILKIENNISLKFWCVPHLSFIFREFNQRRFVSQSRNAYGNFGKFDPVTNPGILAAKTKWHHHLQDKWKKAYNLPWRKKYSFKIWEDDWYKLQVLVLNMFLFYKILLFVEIDVGGRVIFGGNELGFKKWNKSNNNKCKIHSSKIFTKLILWFHWFLVAL